MTVSVPMQRRAPVAPQLVVANGGEWCPKGARVHPLSWSFSYRRWSRGWVGQISKLAMRVQFPSPAPP